MHLGSACERYWQTWKLEGPTTAIGAYFHWNHQLIDIDLKAIIQRVTWPFLDMLMLPKLLNRSQEVTSLYSDMLLDQQARAEGYTFCCAVSAPKQIGCTSALMLVSLLHPLARAASQHGVPVDIGTLFYLCTLLILQCTFLSQDEP